MTEADEQTQEQDALTDEEREELAQQGRIQQTEQEEDDGPAAA